MFQQMKTFVVEPSHRLFHCSYCYVIAHKYPVSCSAVLYLSFLIPSCCLQCVLTVVLSSAVGDIRTSLLRVGEESPSSRRDDERCLSVAYENEVMGSRGLTSGAYYNLPDPARTRDASARSGQSSNSSTLYHFVQSMVRCCCVSTTAGYSVLQTDHCHVSLFTLHSA